MDTTELEQFEPDQSREELIEEVKNRMPDEDTLFELAELYKIFGDHTRVRILCALWEHELCVYDITRILGMTQSATSHQLRVLRTARLVKTRREGKTVFYSLADEHVQILISIAMDHVLE